MDEPWTLAFGRYLRTLRERRGLSLRDVSQLSQAFAEKLTKSYVSRCENGRVKLSLRKVSALGRIYRVSADVMLERIDLDLELERVGAPETAEKTFAELHDRGRDALANGYSWTAYGLLRAAVERDDARPGQIAAALTDCAAAALNLGRARYALYEFEIVLASGAVGPHLLPRLLERISAAHRTLEQFDQAREFAEGAIAAARRAEGREFLGCAYSTRAVLAQAEGDSQLASAFFLESYREFREDHRSEERAWALNGLAQIHFDLGRYRAARRALRVAEKIAAPSGRRRIRARIRILQGRIEAREDLDELAESRWREAAAIASGLGDKILRFKAECPRLEQALRRGNHPAARAISRRMSRLENYVPASTPELREYRRLVSSNRALL